MAASWIAGNYPDVCPQAAGFAVAYVQPDHQTVEVLAGDSIAGLASVYAHDAGPEFGVFKFLRCVRDPLTDEVWGYVQRSHSPTADHAYIFGPSGITEIGDLPFGACAGAVTWEAGELVLYLVLSSSTYVRWPDPLGSVMPAPSATPFTVTLGIRYLSGTTPQWVNTGAGQYHKDANGLAYSMPAGAITVGVSAPSDFSVVVAGGVLRAVIPVQSFEPHATEFGDASGLFAVCARTLSQGGKFAALAIGPPWDGALVAAGSGTIVSPGSNTARNPRKTGSPLVKIAGGNLPGVTYTDPAGRLAVKPFVAGSKRVLTEDGHFTDPDDLPGVGGGGLTGGRWEPMMGGDPLVETKVVTNTQGDAVMVWRPTNQST